MRYGFRLPKQKRLRWYFDVNNPRCIDIDQRIKDGKLCEGHRIG